MVEVAATAGADDRDRKPLRHEVRFPYAVNVKLSESEIAIFAPLRLESPLAV